jgi:hypothetical protein
MQRCLVLQVLGNSDVRGTFREGDQREKGSELLGEFGDYNLAAIREMVDLIEETVRDGSSTISFPLIARLHTTLGNQLEDDWEIHWGIILTNQVNWMEQQTDPDDEGWKEIVASDGFWWKDLLADWLKQKQIKHHFIPLDVAPTVKDGAADWDGMAETIAPLLNEFFPFKGKQIYFQPNVDSAPPEAFDRVVIQHSSGTPALSSALYLWGIEQKLVGRSFDFVYLSIKEDQAQPETFSHEGKHWQWRLKKPQVLKLLGLQDFSGALQLLGEDCPDKTLLQRLQKLDKAAAFNIDALQLNLAPKEDIVERIAIALWTEPALRCHGQWMNWCLRVAGAMELAILCLVEKQGRGNYTWQFSHLKTVLHHPDNPDPDLGFTVGITGVVKHLLSRGSVDQYVDGRAITFCVTPLCDEDEEPHEQWNNFKNFYCGNRGNRWRLSERYSDSFVFVRNNLYHSLSGDRLDFRLDQQTQTLKSAEHPEHPAFIAVGYLRFLIDLAGLKDSVNNRVAFYRSEMKRVHDDLESLA